MNPRILAAPVAAAVIAACLWFFLGTESYVSVGTLMVSAETGGAANGVETGGKTAASENSAAAAEINPAVDWKRFTALLNMDASSGGKIPEPTSEDIARFLAKRGETPANLITVYEKSRDARWLARALELFPNSPIVLMAAVESIPCPAAVPAGWTAEPDAKRMAYIERFKAADPNNPLAWIYSAQEFFHAQHTAEGIAEIRASLDRPAFYTYSNERMDSAQRLYEDMGLHPVEASVLAMVSQTIPHTTAAMQSSRSLTEWQKAATDSGDTAAADDAIQLTYHLGRTFATPEASRTLLGQLVGVSMEARALKALPADAQPAWLVVAPAQRLAEMETQKQNVRDLTAGFDWVMQSQNENLLAEYLRRNRQDGELSALTWLKTQRK